jgi:hypothetical protein
VGQADDEGDVSDERGSAAPASPPPPPRSETSNERALRIASEARDLGRELAKTVGRPPIPSLNQEGTGLAGAVAGLVEAAADQRKADERRARNWRIFVAVLGAIAVALSIIAAVRGWVR